MHHHRENATEADGQVLGYLIYLFFLQICEKVCMQEGSRVSNLVTGIRFRVVILSREGFTVF